LKKTTLINQDISYIVAGMGHKELIVIADRGLPIPDKVRCIDLSISKGIPSFIDCVDAVCSELEVELFIIAHEMKNKNTQIFNFLKKKFSSLPFNDFPHDEFKKMTHYAKAIIRTGEYTPYANVIFVSGVVF